MEYEKCLVELDEILNYLKDEDLRKIPEEIRTAIKSKKDKNYNWRYDESKNLDEQNINRKTIAMLSYLNMEYLLNEEQKILMEELHKLNEEKLEKEKREKYNPDNIFKEKNLRTDNKVNESYNNMQLTIKKEDKWYKKIIKLIAAIFQKDK